MQDSRLTILSFQQWDQGLTTWSFMGVIVVILCSTPADRDPWCRALAELGFQPWPMYQAEPAADCCARSHGDTWGGGVVRKTT